MFRTAYLFLECSPYPQSVGEVSLNLTKQALRATAGRSVLTGYEPRSGLFVFQASQAIESSQRPIMAE